MTRSLFPWGKSPDTHEIGDCVDPIAVSEVLKKRPLPLPGFEHVIVSPYHEPHTDYATEVPKRKMCVKRSS
jgi:hypothetical protein